MPRPNFIFLHSHNTGTFIQPYGHAVPTPNLQRLAEQGVLFRQAFAAAPTCSPSRASFLTGCYPHTAGMLGLAHRGFAMPDYTRHVVHQLNHAGYVTALAGVEHTAPDTVNVGYTHLLHGTGPREGIAPAAVAFLESRSEDDPPFFLSVGLMETHTPFVPADPEHHPLEDVRYCIPPEPLPDTPRTRQDTANFKASARLMDDAYGRILDVLAATGLDRTTYVFCFSDHGLQFPRNMCNLTDRGIHVYCIARGPEHFTGGRVLDEMVSLIDLVPTVYELASVEKPEWVQGDSLLPLADGRVDQLHEQIFAEINYHAAYEPSRCVRTGRYKYIRRYDNRDRPVLPNADPSISRDVLLEAGWANVHREQELLYDLAFDPREMHNLAHDAAHRSVLDEMRNRLAKWMAQNDDPLLPDGRVAAPSGAQYNDPDSLTPQEPTITAA